MISHPFSASKYWAASIRSVLPPEHAPSRSSPPCWSSSLEIYHCSQVIHQARDHEGHRAVLILLTWEMGLQVQICLLFRAEAGDGPMG